MENTEKLQKEKNNTKVNKKIKVFFTELKFNKSYNEAFIRLASK
jgi:hypothetical protein